MKKNHIFLILLALVVVSICAVDIYSLEVRAQAEEDTLPPLDHEFIGAKRCSLCHKKEDQGKQYQIWQDSLHAHAYETLGTDEAKKIAAERGIDDPQKSGECLRCHSTAYYFRKERVTEKIDVEESVSCESCHGPGKDYFKKSIMEDREAAIENGLVIPDETTCVRCHNEESPNYKPFDYEEFWPKIQHPIPE